eukprot:gene20298-31245_t
MSRKGPPRPLPLPLGGRASNVGSNIVVEPAPEAIEAAIVTLRQDDLDIADVRKSLSVLQVVIWKHREKTGKWIDLDANDEIVASLEEAWRVSLTIAIKDKITVCRVCSLETTEHPFCSKTGIRHPTLPLADYTNYRRTYILPARVREMLSGKYLIDLVQMMERHMKHIDVIVFCMMVMTETTSPKLAIDSNKRELLEAGAIPLICNAIEAYQVIEVVAQDACAVLRNLLTHIPTNTLFENIGGAKYIVQCVEKYPMNQELVHRACGCILILASRGAESRKRLFELGTVRVLINVLETPHGREHMVRRLVTTTFQKLVKSIDKDDFCKSMEEIRGFSVINALFNSTRDDDHQGLAEILALRGDLPRGTFVDPNVLVIDEKGLFHHESFVQMMKSNEHREYLEDPPTPTINVPSNWAASQVASPLFPSPPSFGGDDFDHQDPEPLSNIASRVLKARTPGAPKLPQSSLPDVAMADDDLAVYTSQSITTPGTMMQIMADTNRIQSLIQYNSPKGRAVTQSAAQACIAFLSSSFKADGTFDRTNDFASKLFTFIDILTAEVVEILRGKPKLVDMKAPVYVFGDIHGNFGDLHYFMDHLTIFKDTQMTPHSFLFLGDYVDRGMWGPEVMAYLLAYKVLAPLDFVMLRGNHEDVVVNGDVELYGEGCFQTQCANAFQATFGVAKSLLVFEKINSVFKHLPIAAVIENKIFAAHGGIPRFGGGDDIRLETLRDPEFASFD